MIAECIGCREEKEITERNMCSVCIEWERNHLIELENEISINNTCVVCGYVGAATDLHHIYGRKVSPKTIRLCCNCHAEIHRGARTL